MHFQSLGYTVNETLVMLYIIIFSKYVLVSNISSTYDLFMVYPWQKSPMGKASLPCIN